MIRLVAPDRRYQRSYLAAADEFAATGEQRDGDGLWAEEPEGDYAGFSFTRDGLEDPDEFERFVTRRLAAALPETPRKPGWVTCTFLWMVEEDDYVGSLSLRHELSDFLLQEGGHIGYSVRPSARRRGHATEALRQAIPLAATHGIPRLLVTCAEHNAGSRAVIEANGGVYEDSRNGTRRYWIDTNG
jgi:predicted acetyltransferase